MISQSKVEISDERVRMISARKEINSRDRGSLRTNTNVAGNKDPMKFRNGDVSLDEAIEHNGGHLEWANTGILSDTSW